MINQDANHFKVVSGGSDMSETNLNLKGLEKIKTVELEIKKELTATRDLEVLNYIWKHLKKVSSFKLKLESGPFSDNLLQIVSQCLDNCFTIKIDLDGYTEENQSVLPLLKKMLRKGKFKLITLDLSKTKLAWQSLETNILKDMFEQPALEDLVLQAHSTNIPDAYLYDLIFPNSLKRLELDLNWSPSISNKAIGTMTRTALSSLHELQEINLLFHATSITDEELNNVTISSKNLRRFVIDIGRTVITDRVVEFLSQTLTLCVSTLERLIIAFGSTKITDEGLTYLCVKMPRLIHFECYLGVNLISDKAVESLVDNLVTPSTRLRILKLVLCGTNITNASLRKISEKLENIISLELNLTKTLITDEGVVRLIRDVLPTKRCLTVLKLDIAGTAVSENIKNEVSDFAKNVTQQNSCRLEKLPILKG